ncbi:hypothetical protein KC336_g18972, partial [Hortaea werneckii]
MDSTFDDSLQDSAGFVMVERDASLPPGGDDLLPTISQYVDSWSDELRTISLTIHDDPELQYKEHHAHAVLTKYLNQKPGWVVTPSCYGIDTAFMAVYDSGKTGPTVSFNAEY